MPKKSRDLSSDVDNIKTRKTLRQDVSGAQEVGRAQAAVDAPQARTASWAPRFWAWFIDMVIMAVVIGFIFPSAIFTPLDIGVYRAVISFMIVLLYWSLFDSNGRQSVGKRIMDLKLVDEQGNPVGVTRSFVSSLGKSLLLPIDVLIGAVAYPGEKRRLFNMASDTFVVSAVSS